MLFRESNATQWDFRGCGKKKIQKSEIIMEVGGWLQVSLEFFFENHAKTALNQYRHFVVSIYIVKSS